MIHPIEARLLRAWQENGDAAAFQQLVNRHAGMVYGTCRRILGEPVAAEDAAQECFLKLATLPHAIRTSLAGWLHAVATNCALEMRRSDLRRHRREARYSQEHPVAVDACWDDISPVIDELIAELPEKLRYVVIRHFHEGQSQGAIARELAISRPAVGRRIQRGVALLRKRLKRRGIITSTGALSTMLAAGLVEAAPPALMSALGNMALLGPGNAAPAVASTSTTLVPLLAKCGAAGVCVLAGVALTHLYHHKSPPNPPPQAASPAAQPASPAPATAPANAGEKPDAPVLPPEEPPIAEETEPVAPPRPAAPEAEFTYPEPHYGGTPLDYWSPRLEAANYDFPLQRDPPSGSRIISRGKPVSSSNERYPRSGLRRINDGIKEFHERNVVTLPPGPQWVQIHLETRHVVDFVRIWHYYAGQRVYFDVRVVVSNRPDARDAVELFNNDFDNSLGFGAGNNSEYVEDHRGLLVEGRDVTGRYVRCYSHGNTADDENHYIEVEIWGRPLD